MKRRYLILLMGIAAATGAHAQSVGPTTLNATGGTGAISGNTYEWSIGEMVLVHTAISSNLIVTQGLLQPSPPPSGIKKTEALLADMMVYPNPAHDIIYLQSKLAGGGILQYVLQDITGKVLKTETVALITGNEKQTISLEGHAAGSYMLNVHFSRNQQQYQNNFKIEKLH